MSLFLFARNNLIRFLSGARWPGIDTLHFSFDEIREGTHNFSPKMELGAGAFGKVYKVFLNKTLFACKVLKIVSAVHRLWDLHPLMLIIHAISGQRKSANHFASRNASAARRFAKRIELLGWISSPERDSSVWLVTRRSRSMFNIRLHEEWLPARSSSMLGTRIA